MALNYVTKNYTYIYFDKKSTQLFLFSFLDDNGDNGDNGEDESEKIKHTKRIR